MGQLDELVGVRSHHGLLTSIRPGPEGQDDETVGVKPSCSSRWRQRAQQRDGAWLGALKTSWRKWLSELHPKTSVSPS